MDTIKYNILGLTERGETKFLSKLFSGWVDEYNRKKMSTIFKRTSELFNTAFTIRK